MALPKQGILDDFGQKFVGVGKNLDPNPDVERVIQQFGKFTTNAVQDGLLRGTNILLAGAVFNYWYWPPFAARGIGTTLFRFLFFGPAPPRPSAPADE